MAQLWVDGPDYENTGDAFPLTADSILLADFASEIKARRTLDIGCGSGIISLLLAWNNPEMNITAIEISSDAVICARENMRRNGLNSRVETICGDVTKLSLAAKNFDLIVANPPYFKEGTGKRSTLQREENTLTLAKIASVAARTLIHGGALCMVHRPERLADIFETLRAEKLEPKRLRLVSHNKKTAPSLVLIEARRGGRPSLNIYPTLLLKDKNGGDSDEIKRIYRTQ